MTKPIDWESEEQRPAVQVYHRLEVLQQSNLGEDRRWATPSDLASALAAMGEGERAEVLREFDAGARPSLAWLSDVTEALGEVRPEDGAPRALSWTQVVRAIYDQREERDEWRARAEKAEVDTAEARASAARAWRAVSEALKEQRLAEGAQEKAERERDEARKELRSLRADVDALADESTAGAVRTELASLRARLIAAETAAAQREPREYPLAEGSRWEGDEIVESDGMRLSYRRPFVAVYQHGDGVAMKVEARARNLAALLAKRGLL